MNLVLLQNGYPVANISGDTESPLASYHSLHTCNLEGDNTKLLNLIACFVQKNALRFLDIYG
jgi:hypothetical protein